MTWQPDRHSAYWLIATATLGVMLAVSVLINVMVLRSVRSVRPTTSKPFQEMIVPELVAESMRRELPHRIDGRRMRRDELIDQIEESVAQSQDRVREIERAIEGQP